MKHHENLVFAFILLGLAEVYNGQECNFTQVHCISCNKYQACTDGNLEEVLSECKDGTGCGDPRLEECQSLLHCYSDVALFTYALALDECTDIGIFKDSLSESNFYVCLTDSNSGFIKLGFSCLEGEFFDESTLQCVSKSFTLPENSTSPSTVTLTTGATEPSSTESTTLKVSPDVPSTTEAPVNASSSETSTEPSTESSTSSTVPDDETANTTESSAATDTSSSSTDSSSIDPTTPSVTDNATQSSVATDVPETSTPSITSPIPLPSVCTSPGIFADPTNCKGYYRCSTALIKFDYLCPGISYFNEEVMKCSLIITPTCQSQILMNSTTQSPPTTKFITSTASSLPTTTQFLSSVSTVSSTTTPESVTALSVSTTSSTTTSTSTVTHPPSAITQTPPFICPSEGTFADPTSCKTYIRCSASGKSFTYTCPGNTYFNNVTKTCGLIMTPQCSALSNL